MTSNLLWRPAGAVLALLAVLGPAHAQIAVAPVPNGIPGSGIRMGAVPGAAGALGTVPTVGGYALSTTPAGNPYLSTGSLAASPYGGYSLLTAPYTGGYIPPYSLPYYDYGRLDPYSGYLQGLASVTSATGQYYKDIQTARMTRYAANMAALDYARARIRFEREYESGRRRAWRDELAAEKVTALETARRDAPTSMITSGRALNELLKSVKAAGSLDRGAPVPLDDDVLRRINLLGKAPGNAGMLRNGGKLTWPSGLMEDAFSKDRDLINRNLEAAVKSIKDGAPADDRELVAARKELNSAFDNLQKNLNDSTATLPIGQYLEAKRYLAQLKDAITALRDPQAKNFLDNTWSAKGRTVAELVDYMRDKGLEFNAATPGDEAAYASLYDSLRRFERSMTSGQP